MKLISKNSGKCSTIRVRIESINGTKLDCTHVSSGFKIKATMREDMNLEIGQIVILEFTGNNRNSGYIVVDDLIEEIDATVLDTQHIISEGIMYTSIILENPNTKSRIHSLVPNYEKLFDITSIIVKGDVIRVKINNGKIFDIISS